MIDKKSSGEKSVRYEIRVDIFFCYPSDFLSLALTFTCVGPDHCLAVLHLVAPDLQIRLRHREIIGPAYSIFYYSYKGKDTTDI